MRRDDSNRTRRPTGLVISGRNLHKIRYAKKKKKYNTVSVVSTVGKLKDLKTESIEMFKYDTKTKFIFSVQNIEKLFPIKFKFLCQSQKLSGKSKS